MRDKDKELFLRKILERTLEMSAGMDEKEFILFVSNMAFYGCCRYRTAEFCFRAITELFKSLSGDDEELLRRIKEVQGDVG